MYRTYIGPDLHFAVNAPAYLVKVMFSAVTKLLIQIIK